MPKKYRIVEKKYRIIRGADGEITKKVNTWMSTGYIVKTKPAGVNPLNGELILEVLTYKRETIK